MANSKGKKKETTPVTQEPKSTKDVVAQEPTTPEVTPEIQVQLEEQQQPQEPVAQEKDSKRKLTWEERLEFIPTSFQSDKLKEILSTRASAVLGATRETLLVKGYNDGGKKSFKEVYGVSWKAAKETLNPVKGKVVTFSMGSAFHHFIVIIPNEPIKVTQRDGSEIELTKDNCLEHLQGGTLHGRIYKKAKRLAYEYGLAFEPIPEGQYCKSNAYNINLQLVDGKCKVWTRNGNLRELPCTPEDLLIDIVNGGEKWKVING